MCQAGGWGLYTLYVLTLTAQYERGWHAKSMVSVVGFLLIVCPFVTHVLRAWIIRNHWLEMSATRTIPRAAVAVLLMSTVLGGATGVVNVLVLRNGGWDVWWPRTM